MEVLDPRWSAPAPPWEIANAVSGRRIERLDRRGKYLVWELSGDVHLVMHLRMTGNLLYTDDARFARVRIRLDDGGSVVFADQRRFGTGVVLLGSDARDDYFASRLGVEPLSADFTADHLRELARGRRAPAKAFLLNQERIAGVGNIYADEALFIARIHPLRPDRHAQAQAVRGAARGGGRGPRGRHRRARRDDRRLPPRRRRRAARSRTASSSTCAPASRASAAARRS